MGIDLIPTVLGAIIGIVGVALLVDARGSPEAGPLRERRRRIRTVINLRGETLTGIGFVLIAAALIGRDRWRYETAAILAGGVLITLGAVANRQYIREMLLFRGAARRGGRGHPPEKGARLRIR